MSVPIPWVLGLMTVLEPSSPWKDTFERSATAIAHAAESDPLYAGDAGPERTASLLVAVAWYESRLKPDAKSADGNGMCLFQVDKRHLEDPARALTDPEVCTKAAMRVLKFSFDKCAFRSADERLAAFTSGTCDKGLDASRYRAFLGGKLLREHPVVYPRVDTQEVPVVMTRALRGRPKRSSS